MLDLRLRILLRVPHRPEEAPELRWNRALRNLPPAALVVIIPVAFLRETRAVTATFTTAGVTRAATASTALSRATSDETLLSSIGDPAT